MDIELSSGIEGAGPLSRHHGCQCRGQEADNYELFHEALNTEGGAQLLVRASKGRRRKIDGLYLWDFMMKQPSAGRLQINVAKRKGQWPKRTATIEVRFAKAELKPPIPLRHLSPIEVWHVYAREIEYNAEVKKPIDWMLTTLIPTDTFDQACERLDWYAKRWGIEVYHRVVKSGCRIKDRNLDHVSKLENALVIDLVVAWLIFCLNPASSGNARSAVYRALK